jgi:hypothetical protein
MAPGCPAREDYEYERDGRCALFMLDEPLRGWREVAVGEHRRAVGWAQVIEPLVDVHYPEAERIVPVMDDLKTHPPGSLDAALEPTEAKRPADKLEIHSTPAPASWLNLAETDLRVLSRQCLGRRIPDQHTVVAQTPAWMHERNVDQTTHRLALHHCRCSPQAQAPLPRNPAVKVP